MQETRYRSHTCGELREEHAGTTVTLAGWVHRKRDHGQLLFVDLRDHYGITQCVVAVNDPDFETADRLSSETVVSIGGTVVARSAETVNTNLPTGQVELNIEELEVLSEAHQPNLDSAASGCELDRVGSEIPHHLLEPLGIARDQSHLHIEAGVENDTLRICRRPHRINGRLDCRGQRNRLHVQSELPRDRP